MTRNCDDRATQLAAAILRIASGLSGDDLSAAFLAARRAVAYSLEEAGADDEAGLTLLETLDGAATFSRCRA